MSVSLSNKQVCLIILTLAYVRGQGDDNPGGNNAVMAPSGCTKTLNKYGPQINSATLIKLNQRLLNTQNIHIHTYIYMYIYIYEIIIPFITYTSRTVKAIQ